MFDAYQLCLFVCLLPVQSTPWNVDTLSEDGFQKTVINKYDAKPETEMTEDEIENKHVSFNAAGWMYVHRL